MRKSGLTCAKLGLSAEADLSMDGTKPSEDTGEQGTEGTIAVDNIMVIQKKAIDDVLHVA